MSIDCTIADVSQDIVVATCVLSGSSQGQCSKRPLRNPDRDKFAKQMVETGAAASKIHNAEARKLMTFGKKSLLIYTNRKFLTMQSTNTFVTQDLIKILSRQFC